MESFESTTENVTIQITTIENDEDKPSNNQDPNSPETMIMATYDEKYLFVNQDLQLIGEELSRKPSEENYSLFQEYTILQRNQEFLCYTIKYKSENGSMVLLAVDSDGQLVLEPMTNTGEEIANKFLFIRRRKSDGSGMERIESFLCLGTCLEYLNDTNTVVTRQIEDNNEAQYFYVYGVPPKSDDIPSSSSCLCCCFRRKKKKSKQLEDMCDTSDTK